MSSSDEQKSSKKTQKKTKVSKKRDASSSSSNGKTSTPKKSSAKKKTTKSSSSSTQPQKSRTMKTVAPPPKPSPAKTTTPKTPASPKSVGVSPALMLGGFDEYKNMKVSGELSGLQNALPLDFVDTPMSPETLEERFGKTNLNVTGLNIMLQDEDKLVIPDSVKGTLLSLFVTSSRLSGHLKLTDISALGGCKALKELSLARCNTLTKLEPLHKCHALEVVDLSHCSALKTLGGEPESYVFRHAMNLHTLNLSHCTSLVEARYLEGSHNLRSLDMSHCESVPGLTFVSHLPNLNVLDVSHCTSVEPVSFHFGVDPANKQQSCYSLTELNIHGSSLEKDHCVNVRQAPRITVGSWNILASGLEVDGFLTVDGLKSVAWEERSTKVATVISNMLMKNHVVVTQENDNFFWILNFLQRRLGASIKGVWCCKTLPPKEYGGDFTSSNARAFYIKRMASAMKAAGSFDEANLANVDVLLKLAPKEFAPRCAELYNIVNAANLRTLDFPSFTNILGNGAQEFASFYGLDAGDTYISDDGIGFYYDEQKMTLQSVGDALFSVVDSTSAMRAGVVNGVPVLWNKDGWTDVTFETNFGQPVTVYGCHLASGEEAKNEIERVATMKTIMSSLKSLGNVIPILAMDSNVSPEYETAFPEVKEMFSGYIKAEGLADAIAPGTFPCFKMRGPGSEQAKKVGELMVDQIDKILYFPGSLRLVREEHPLDEYGFQRLSPQSYAEVYAIRTNQTLREENNKTVKAITNKQALVTDVYTDVNTPFVDIYPGPNAPSDHPPVSATFVVGVTPIEELTTAVVSPRVETKEEVPEVKSSKTFVEKPATPKTWDRDRILEHLTSELTVHYTTGRTSVGLEPHNDTQLGEVLDAHRKKMGKIAGAMLEETTGKKFKGFEAEDFHSYLEDNKLLPSWKEEAAKKAKTTPKTKTPPKESSESEKPPPKTTKATTPVEKTKVKTPAKEASSSESEKAPPPKTTKVATPVEKKETPKTKVAAKEESSSSTEPEKAPVKGSKTKTPPKEEWTVKSLRKKLDEEITGWYTTGREDNDLKPYKKAQIAEILEDEKKSKKLDKIAAAMLAGTKEDDYTGYENDAFREYLEENGFFPDWKAEAKAAAKKSSKKK